MPATESVVRARGLTKRFGERTAVAGIDLDVPPGVCFGLLGPNGAGKTTTMRMLYGVCHPSGGEVSVFGLSMPAARREIRRRLGVTLQENSLVEALTPVENLRVFGRYHLLSGEPLEARIRHLVDFLELGSHADVPARALSGGYQRRLAIAMSLIGDPELLILDEPTTGLDPGVRLALWRRVRELRSEGKTILVSTHYMDEAERLCDEVAILDGGRILARDTPARLIASRLAAQTVELDCTPAEEEQLLAGSRRPEHQLRSGARLILHVDDGAALVERMRAADPLPSRPYVVRPTNLEDVFLAVTGGSLESGS
jgi:lipooligosaccharide transport system ATP-binding protein